ncbi:MAG: xylulokinase [Betaproteobacteria bacterium AqS2]|uniref:Xylulose kinase n=1 Tax=Candidatus Amphirhobacter heronislandensis TaxID=1732024 RepID=A0A930UBF5_9GAMM|nr:xylulokinase [Betaproteobacteria bacterium AqS2]
MAAAGFLGIDIGTSACKAALVDEAGAVIATATAEYPLEIPQPGWSQQRPEDWWEGACAAVTELRAAAPDAEVKGIGLSGQMHGLVALDRADQVIRPAILWNDMRNPAECEEVRQAAGGIDGLVELSNNDMVIGYTGGKLLWLRRHEPDNFERMALFLNPKDYILLRLTGARSTEVSDASGTGLFDVRKRRWSAELIDKLGLDMAVFPKALESDQVAGELGAEAAARMNLPAGLPVVAGGGDGVCQSTGSGVIRPGVFQTILGTAGIVACALDEPVRNDGGRLQVFCNNGAALWHCMGGTISAGAALAWLRRLLASAHGLRPEEMSYAAMMERAAAAPPGAAELFFLPYLQGERCPYENPNARGSFIGLNLKHDAGHMIRAVIEGVTYSLGHIAALMRERGVSGDVAIASGGGAASVLWRQIQADVLGCEVTTVSGADAGAAYGAALLAGVGCGHWQDLAAACAGVKEDSRLAPVAAHAALYKEGLARHAELYRLLEPAYPAQAS